MLFRSIASLIETAQAADDFVGQFLWRPINDDQTAGWTDILQTTTITDIGGFGSATFAGAPFAGLNNTVIPPNSNTWNPIHDDTTPNWVPVLT